MSNGVVPGGRPILLNMYICIEIKTGIMDTQDRKFLEEHPNAEFVGFIKVGSRGVKMYYTDRATYEQKLDRAWDSGLDLESGILKGKE